MRTLISIFLLLMTGWSATATYGEDGSRLWLRLDTVSTSMITGVKGTAMTELQTYWQGGPVVLKRQKGIAKDGYAIKSQDGKIGVSSDKHRFVFRAWRTCHWLQMGWNSSSDRCGVD